MVDTVSKAVRDMLDTWQTCRDVLGGGSRAVKAAGVRYLPILEAHATSENVPLNPITGQQGAGYRGYSARAMFYPAGRRTVQGLTGLVFGHPPTLVDVPKAQEAQFKDVTLNGVSIHGFAVTLCSELLRVGRAGVLLELPNVLNTKPRPYWVRYLAEQIINWREDMVRGQKLVTLLVLKEKAQKPGKTEFDIEEVDQWRVLRLVPDTTGKSPNGMMYTQTVYRKKKTEAGGGALSPEQQWENDTTVIPLSRGQVIPFIPFTFFGPTSITPDIEDPPLEDLAEVNLSHFRTSADREQGAHLTALPTPYISGHSVAQGEKLAMGGGTAWVLPNVGATAGMVEFSGKGLGALKDLMEEKRQLMATLGARMLETQKNVQEAHMTVKMRHSAESSALVVLGNALADGLTQLIQRHLSWAAIDEAAILKAGYKVNPDALDHLTPEDIKALVLAQQAGNISKKTVYDNLKWGEWVRDGVEWDEEEQDIEAETPEPLDIGAITGAIPELEE